MRQLFRHVFEDNQIDRVHRSSNEFGPYIDGRSVYQDFGRVIGAPEVLVSRLVINGVNEHWTCTCMGGSPDHTDLTAVGYEPREVVGVTP